MQVTELETAIERFTTALSSLQNATERMRATLPMEEKERAQAVTRIDQAITALRKVLGEEAPDGSGNR